MANVDTGHVDTALPADVPFIDAQGDWAASESGADEREADPCTAPPPPAAGNTLQSCRTPLKSALKRGTARRRLQVVINESRNTYCEAAAADSEEDPAAPTVVRAFSLHLPQTADDAFDRMVAEGEPLQETPVDDSEGRQHSATITTV